MQLVNGANHPDTTDKSSAAYRYGGQHSGMGGRRHCIGANYYLKG
ncbi:hypothetical protein LMG24238_04673 [Paraburkholderia sediminicola]|uniref:Uncharacterized protein n=1 Tax=Paraburkholderia sediminicola TaxID=458836 RepID=A0A6J5BYM9_9BURK|nr:hypothetical protein LMG24238_04673 [Paraburkholderia sediminicola]